MCWFPFQSRIDQSYLSKQENHQCGKQERQLTLTEKEEPIGYNMMIVHLYVYALQHQTICLQMSSSTFANRTVPIAQATPEPQK